MPRKETPLECHRRIVAAAGCVPEAVAPFAVEDLSVSVNGVEVCRSGGAHRDRDEIMTAVGNAIEDCLAG